MMAATLLVDALPGSAGSNPAYCGEFQGKLIFATSAPSSSTWGTTHVWSTDGTPQGTRRIGTVPNARFSHRRQGFADAAVHEGQLYFIPTNPSAFGSGIGLVDLTTGAVSSSGKPLSPYGYHPYGLSAERGFITYTNFYRLSDGFGYGTYAWGRGMIRAQPFYGVYEGFTVRGRGVGLLAETDNTQGPLHLLRYSRTEGFEARLLRRDVPDQRLLSLAEGNLALFAGSETEVWTTDGTPAGTRKLADVDPMATHAVPTGRGVTLIGYTNGKLLYVRETPEHGREPWAERLDVALPALPPAPTVQLAPGMDTGASSTDGITKNNRPTFTGTAAPGSEVTLMVGGAPLGTAPADADGRYSITPDGPLYTRAGQPPSTGAGEVEVRVRAVDEHGNASASARLDLVVDIAPPAVNDRTRLWGRASELEFSMQDTSPLDRATLTARDFVVTNLTTGQTLDPSAMVLSDFRHDTFARPSFSATFRFPQLPGGELPAGRYRVTVAAGAVADIAGNALGETLVREFVVGEPRNLTPAPAIRNGTLWLNGSDAYDSITVWRSPTSPQRLVVVVNGTRSVFDLGAISVIRGDTGAGDDVVLVKENGGRIETPVSIVGGAGNDSITTASGRDTLYGLDGDDVLVGGAGDDRLDAGAGDDQLFGGAGRDLLFGRAGRDAFWRGDAAAERRDLAPLEDLVR